MRDILFILLATLAFILVLLNNTTLSIVGVVLGSITLVLVILMKNITIVTKVSVLILDSLSLIIGILWLISFS